MQTRKWSAAVIVALGCVASSAYAVNIAGTSASNVVNLDTYTQYGGGDVVFGLATNSLQASCPGGFWIRATDAGAKSTIAQVLAAYQTGSPVMVWADIDAASPHWSGSSAPTCLVWNVRNP